MYLARRQKAKQQGDRRSVFLRYLGEVANAVSEINGGDSEALYKNLLKVAERITSAADIRMDDRGKVIDKENYGDNVLIVEHDVEQLLSNGDENDQTKLF